MDQETRHMFRVKICGVTCVADAAAVAASGADAVGLNFYAKSPRFVDDKTAREIVDLLPPRMVKVGLFVNADEGDMLGRRERLGLDMIQLHGDESPEMIARLAERLAERSAAASNGLSIGLPVMKAFRVGPQGLGPVYDYISRTERLGCRLRAVLLDAFSSGAYGGTGRLTDWALAAQYATVRATSPESLPPLVLAGGLKADNVARAIQTVCPAAVDTASGVESSPGKKDPAAVRDFVEAALREFNRSGR